MSEGWRLVVRAHGGPEAIVREAFDVPEPMARQVLIRTEAVGLNFIDTYFRTGLYPAPLPIQLGSESAGEVIAVGPSVDTIRVGDRIGSVNGPGAYATHRIVETGQAVRLPDSIGCQTAATVMLKGFTAGFLAEDIIALGKGDTALVHSAAGGVGAILVPWLRDKGVTVIAHSGTQEKAEKVQAEYSLCCTFDELPEQVRKITQDRLADIVFDGVGQASWSASLACLRPRGMMVSYGNASGKVAPVNLLDLMRAGSLFVTRPTLADYIATPEALRLAADRLFDRIERGIVVPQIGQRFGLDEAPQAHAALEARQTTGSTLLIP